MNPAAAMPFPVAMPGQLRQPAVHKNILFQALFCSLPAMALFGAVSPTYASLWLVPSLLLMMLWNLNYRNRFAVLTLVVACLPTLVILRSIVFPHNTPLAMMGLALLYAISDRDMFSRIWNVELPRGFVLFLLLYWWFSIMAMLDYSANMRVMDLAASALSVYLLSTRRSYLQTALLGLAIGEIALAVAMLPQSQRLGMIEGAFDDSKMTIGNPILIGLPCAMIIVWGLGARGRWLGLDSKPLFRIALMAAGAAFLFLSTSRGALFACIVTATVVLILDNSSRRNFVILAALGAVVLSYVVTTDKGEYALRYLLKLTDENKTFEQRTTGRIEQWYAMPAAFRDSPIWGHGLGRNREIAQVYTGRLLAWHSLYLHFIAETGLLGLVPVLVFIALVFSRALKHWSVHGDAVPTAAIVGFAVTGLSVNCLDATSGLWMGVALTAVNPVTYFVPRIYRLREETPAIETTAEEVSG